MRRGRSETQVTYRLWLIDFGREPVARLLRDERYDGACTVAHDLTIAWQLFSELYVSVRCCCDKQDASLKKDI